MLASISDLRHQELGLPPRSVRFSLFLLSAATLTFEINLTRLFSVAQFYHFAFLVISIALLGFGLSGTVLAIFPGLGRKTPQKSIAWLSLLTSATFLGAYLLTNWLPFDSFSITWDRKQVWILVFHYIALALPFFFSGMVVGLLLDTFPQVTGQIYSLNLMGSALGCILAMFLPSFLECEGTVVSCTALSALAAIISGRNGIRQLVWTLPLFLSSILFIFSFLDFGLRIGGGTSFPWLELRLSPYKSLSYVLQQPGAHVLYRRWNTFSRVDLVRSSGVHSIPGLSFRYLKPLPTQDALFVNGDDLNPVIDPSSDLDFTGYLPSAIAFDLHPHSDVLILEPSGGLDILSALSLGAKKVTAVEVNPLIVDAAGFIYHDPRVRVVVESGRCYLRRAGSQYDIVILSLPSSYHPVRSGAYSLAEDYRYTVESFQDALALLDTNGMLVVTRWLQDPPSEELRTFALAVTALENNGTDPGRRIVAFRGYNTATFLIKNEIFSSKELQIIRIFAAERAFDMIYAPNLQPEETNIYNILPVSTYLQSFRDLLKTIPRQAFYSSYPYDVSPPTDDHPFFGHYFKWSQARQVWTELGKTWQPFGGAGYFLVLALLILVILLAVILILLPVVIRKSLLSWRAKELALPLVYFILIGFAFLLVEIPLIQQFILYLGHPAYAMTTVLFALLLFSGIGSQWGSKYISLRIALVFLFVLLIFTSLGLHYLITQTLGFPLAVHIGLTIIVLAPISFLMGIPFPAGIGWLRSILRLFDPSITQGHIPWIWAVNGTASVIASVLASLLALSLGFSWTFRTGAFCYLGALLVLTASESRFGYPHR